MIEQIRDDELDLVNGGNGGHRGGIDVSVRNSFNTGGTTVGNVDIDADRARVSLSIGSSGGIYVSV
jgi:hypothetical protein